MTARLAIAAAAFAAFLPAVGAKATPVAARVEADAIIRAAGAGDLFENVTTGTSPEVRHRASGLVCEFEPGALDNRITIDATRWRSEDVACETRVLGALQTQSIVRKPAAFSLDDMFDYFLSDIARAHPDARPAKGGFAVAKSQGGPALPERRTRRLTYAADGQESFARLSVAQVGDWIVEQRVTAQAKDAFAADLAAEIALASNLSQAAARR